MSEKDYLLEQILRQWSDLSLPQKQFLAFMAKEFGEDNDMLNFLVSFPIRKDGLLAKRRHVWMKFLPIQKEIPEESFQEALEKLADYFYPIGLEKTEGKPENIPFMLKGYLKKDIYIWRD